MSQSMIIITSILAPGVCILMMTLLRDRQRLRALISDHPIRKISALERGIVAVKGKVYPARGESMKSPLTGTECVWYALVVEKLSRAGKSQRWKPIETVYKSVEGVLRDRTGECHLDLRHVEYRFPHKHIHDPTEGGRRLIPHTDPRSMTKSRAGQLRYVEYVITRGTTLYAIGSCKDLNRGDFYLVGTRNRELLVSKRPLQQLIEDSHQRLGVMWVLMIGVGSILYFVFR